MNSVIAIIFILLMSCGSKSKDTANSNMGVKKELIPPEKEVINVQENVDTVKVKTKETSIRKTEYTTEKIREWDHDPHAYTQGLLFFNGFIYESTGLKRKSTLRKISPMTGMVVSKTNVPGTYFAEGITILNEKLYLLTYEAGVCFVLDPETFAQIRTFTYLGEGWGLTNDGKNLIMSNGTSELRIVDPETFDRVSVIYVNDKGRPVRYLNELEYINGEIFANIFMQDRIVRIDPKTGEVLQWMDFSELRISMP